MVCIPCIVIPVLLWVYKKFLEPILYPFISPFISRLWPKRAMKEEMATPKAGACNGAMKSEYTTMNGELNCIDKTTHGITTEGPQNVSDKKTD
ncbi:UPF0729 protein C18orf32 homolog isoform X1 [Scyliorhinus canicula]|uniref:UPF0729 protein C18orf32 homolog isoform X1 n=1 Tax=Scyliorhinus canicula TaxID=7830 RepID=UPI0018F4032E|nr:UPF0729 protein C18orf32 homolog isoform X1 [Scyliorhinus canicula]